MNNKLTIAIDVDLTITRDLGALWWMWLVEKYKRYQTLEQYTNFCCDYYQNNVEYNLTKYFNIPDYENPYAFWEQCDLYDDEVLTKGCYDVVKRLHEQGHKLIFVSHTLAGHIESKFKFLQRNFDFIKNVAFVATMDKSIMNGCVDAVVEDRASNLALFDDYILKLLYKTPYKQDEIVVDKQYEVCETWQQIEEQIDLYKENM